MTTNQLDCSKVEEGVNNLLKILKAKSESSIKLLQAPEPVFLQIEFVKIPKIKKVIARIPLDHSLLTNASEVCFIPADLIRGRKVNHELTVNHYNKLFKKHGVNDVQKIQIIPSRQIRVEYNQYEARRKLCNTFDVFLIDNKISRYLFPKLGKTFDRARKWPIPIRVKRKNLKDEIMSKLKKTSMALDGHGLVKTVQVGHLDMTARQISENILSVSKYIRQYFPAGWINIRSLHIKGLRSIALPIFMSLISPNDVPTPKFRRKKKKSVLAVDELSTIGKKVSVYRCGKVIVRDGNSSESETEDREETVTNV